MRIRVLMGCPCVALGCVSRYDQGMVVIKKVLLGILVVALIAVSLYTAMNRGMLSGSQFAALNQSKEENLDPLVHNISGQAQVLGARTQEVGSHVQKVLGSYVQSRHSGDSGSSSSDRPNQSKASEPALHEKAFEYGRYLYCQQVVKDYESRYPEKDE